MKSLPAFAVSSNSAHTAPLRRAASEELPVPGSRDPAACTVLRNTRTIWPPKRGWGGGFLRSFALRSAALALVVHTRKSWPPKRGWGGGFLRSFALRSAALALVGILCFAEQPTQPECNAANHGRFWPEEANSDRALARKLYQSGELEMCSLVPPKYTIYWKYKWQHLSVNAHAAARTKTAQPTKVEAEPQH